MLTSSILCDCIILHCVVALAQAIHSIIKVTVIKLTRANEINKIVLRSQPAFAKALGNVRAPVPTIRLNTYITPTYKNERLQEYNTHQGQSINVTHEEYVPSLVGILVYHLSY